MGGEKLVLRLHMRAYKFDFICMASDSRLKSKKRSKETNSYIDIV